MWKKSDQKQELNCPQVKALWLAYFDGELSETQQEAVHDHLATCAPCAEHARQAQALEKQLFVEARRQRPRLSPQTSAHIRERVYQRVRRGLMIRRALQFAGRAASLVAALALLIGLFAFFQEPSPTTKKEENGHAPRPARVTAQPPVSPLSVPTGEETVITFVTFDWERPTYQQLAAKFHASHPGIRVKLVSTGSFSYPPVDNAWMAAIAEAGDCFAGTFPFADPGTHLHLYNLQPLLDQDPGFDLADFYPSALEPLQHDGGLWGIPHGMDALVVYYDPQRFAEAGLPLPEPGWTTNDFLAAAAALGGNDQFGFATREGTYGDLIFALERLGARLFENPAAQAPSTTPRPSFDDPTVVSALEQYVALSHRQQFSPATDPWQWVWPYGYFDSAKPDAEDYRLERVENKEVAMWVAGATNHLWTSPQLPFEVRVAPLPLRRDNSASTEFEVYAYYISAHTQAPQACWEWLTFLSREPRTTTNGELPARRSMTQLPFSLYPSRDEPAFRTTLEYENTSVFSARLKAPWLGYTYPWLYEAFVATKTGDDAEQALSRAQRKADKFLLCLEQAGGFADWEIRVACAKRVDP
jgi:ABC-type glycerol-3-phosphate transport system substrate-binding protein